MADDVLSQSEIDKLLAQFASGEADAETMQKEEPSEQELKETAEFFAAVLFGKEQTEN